MPNVLLEAWCRGVPALVLSHDPDNVVTRYGLGGFASDSRDDLVKLARHQWITRADRSQLGERCRSYVAEHHSPTVVAAKWLNVVGRATRSADESVVTAPESTCAA
jgi:glycosyltransferase involved in cell wall biosynthesis